MRIARRRRRNLIIASSIASVLIVVIAVVMLVLIGQQQARVAATNDLHATATAKEQVVQVTATINAQNAQATAAVNTLIKQNPKGATTPPATSITPTTLPGGLKYITLTPGSGTGAQKGQAVSVEYTGWVAGSNKKFDSSYDNGGSTFAIQLGQGQVIKGWDQGLIGIKQGETRRLIIPPSLGYGSQAQKDQSGKVVIPANATLIFDVTAVNTGSLAEQQLQQQEQQQQQQAQQQG